MHFGLLCFLLRFILTKLNANRKKFQYSVNGAQIVVGSFVLKAAPIASASFITRKAWKKMTDLTAGIICIQTTEDYMRIGPFVFDDHLSESFIEHKIHETLIENNLDYIIADMVEDIVVIFVNDDFEGIYSPKIEDVWPRDFGPKQFVERMFKKGGEK